MQIKFDEIHSAEQWYDKEYTMQNKQLGKDTRLKNNRQVRLVCKHQYCRILLIFILFFVNLKSFNKFLKSLKEFHIKIKFSITAEREVDWNQKDSITIQSDKRG